MTLWWCLSLLCESNLRKIVHTMKALCTQYWYSFSFQWSYKRFKNLYCVIMCSLETRDKHSFSNRMWMKSSSCLLPCYYFFHARLIDSRNAEIVCAVIPYNSHVAVIEYHTACVFLVARIRSWELMSLGECHTNPSPQVNVKLVFWQNEYQAVFLLCHTGMWFVIYQLHKGERESHWHPWRYSNRH